MLVSESGCCSPSTLFLISITCGPSCSPPDHIGAGGERPDGPRRTFPPAAECDGSFSRRPKAAATGPVVGHDPPERSAAMASMVQETFEDWPSLAGYKDVLRGEPVLAATYPSAIQDKLFEATYRHMRDGTSYEECGYDGKLVPYARLEQDDGPPTVHFGLIALGDTVMKSGKDRNDIVQEAGVVGFEMVSAGVWDIFPCVVIKGACDYADSHKIKAWPRYAAATAAACMKAFLDYWIPSMAGA